MLLEVNRQGSQAGDDFAPPDQLVQADSETFDVQYVLPGQYDVRAYSAEYNAGAFAFGSVDVKVDSKQNEPVVVEMNPGLAVRGQLVVVDDTDPSNSPATKGTSIVLESKSGHNAIGRSAQVADDGTFLLSGLFPGRWKVSLRGREKRYVRAVEMGARQMEGSEVEIAEGDAGPLKIRAGRVGAGTVGGVLEGAGSGGGAAAAGRGQVRVLLYPVRAGAIDLTRDVGQASVRDGRFQMGSVAPGEYFSLAVDGRMLGPRAIANLMAPRAETFFVEDGVTKNVKVRVLTGEEILEMAMEYLRNPGDR